MSCLTKHGKGESFGNEWGRSVRDFGANLFGTLEMNTGYLDYT